MAICADEQTAGRGRLDHQWTSAVGESFIVSLVVSVPTAIVRDTSVNGWLQMIAGLVTLDALNGMIEEYGAAPNQPLLQAELTVQNVGGIQS